MIERMVLNVEGGDGCWTWWIQVDTVGARCREIGGGNKVGGG